MTRCLPRWSSGAVFLVVMAIPSAAFPQARAVDQSPPVKVRPGDPSADGSFLKPYKNAWKVVYAFPGKEPFLVGVWTDELVEVEIDGRHLMKRTQIADYAKAHVTNTITNVFDPKTMVPVWQDFRRNNNGNWAHREFNGSTVKYTRGDTADQARPDAGELRLPEGVFDYDGGMFGVFLASLPLKEGYKATFPTLSEDSDELVWITISVGKEESIDAGPGKKITAWPVDTEGPYANKSHSIFWISKEAPYVIQLVTTVASGRWVTVTMTML